MARCSECGRDISSAVRWLELYHRGWMESFCGEECFNAWLLRWGNENAIEREREETEPESIWERMKEHKE